MKLWHYLDNPLIWESSRIGLDFVFGLYRKRINLMQQWGVLQDNPSVIDIGCGIGHYANLTTGPYLGIDMNGPYVRHARKRHRRPNQSFRCEDVTVLLAENRTFELVLMVDFLHHLTESQGLKLLSVAAKLAGRYVVSFEPVTDQPHPVGRWIVENDRGCCVRPLETLHQLFTQSALEICESRALRLGPINTRAILAKPH
jgi:SAM-dependent methyltransferase